ncbi:hypothetical protein [Halosegnis rubeus]|uniref:Uncharacterized protein n=1 Tax=Halosegnis rubeus TaxID=2212850 RepID=A0A5N5UL54_9EURY|nr:hypothetical protein [Halosegnis rubeus]KAB7518342.1 hypothetical protein DMP03_03015 [Halosegnis rubeus]
MEDSGIGRLLGGARTNASLAWAVIAFTFLVAVANAVAVAPLWAGFALVVGLLGLVVPVVYRDPTAMLPWELLLLAALPLLARVVASLAVFRSDIVTYVAVATVALLIAVELHLLTPVEMSYRFAVGFVVITTMAAAGIWALVRYGSDAYLGTQLLLPPGGPNAPREALSQVEHKLMVEFVASFIAGIGAGVLFEGYFRRQHRGEDILEQVEVELS